MKLSIICLHLNTPKNNPSYSNTDFYDQCLEILLKYPINYDYEIITIDNGSTNKEALGNFVNKWKNIANFYYLPENIGHGRGYHYGSQFANGEYILVLNPDIEVFENTINDMIKYMDENPNVAVIGPKLLFPDGETQDTFRTFMGPFDWLIKRLKFLHKIPFFKKRMTHHLMWNVKPTEPMEVDWMHGALIMIRKDHYDKVGGFDHRYFLLVEEMDLCRTFWKNGYKVIYHPQIQAIHNHKRISGGSFWRAFFKKNSWHHLHSLVKYFFKWGISTKRHK